MKKVLIIPFLISGISLCAQKVDDAKKFLYYERYQSAENLLHQILKADPSNAEGWYFLTDAYLNQKEIKKASDSLQLAPQEVKDEPFYQVAMGTVLLQQKSADKAKPYFDQALDKTKEKNADILLAVAKANIDAEAGNVTEAIEYLNKAIKRDKHNPELYAELGNAYRKLNDGSKAYQAYQEAISADDKYAAADYQMGMIFVTQKNPSMYLKFFNQAIEADPQYAPAYYQLYFHYYFKNVNTAMDYLKKYIANTDHTLQNDYDYTDMLYLTGKYNDAITNAKALLAKENEDAPPRLYKLIAYSYKENKNPDDAFSYMQKYFAKAPDSIEIVKDFSTMADLYNAKKQSDSAVVFYQKAVSMATDSVDLVTFYKKLADIAKQEKDYANEAKWLEKYCNLNTYATNVDLFNWGIANYLNKDYQNADSVFARYAAKYPDQDFGYYWRARSCAAIDTAMELGIAVPQYTKVIAIDSTDTTNATNKKHLIEAYGYLAAYEANHDKDYQVAIDYFEKLLTLDPGNDSAKQYIDILKKNLEQTGTEAETVSGSQ